MEILEKNLLPLPKKKLDTIAYTSVFSITNVLRFESHLQSHQPGHLVLIKVIQQAILAKYLSHDRAVIQKSLCYLLSI